MKIPIIYDKTSEDSNNQQWNACLSCTVVSSTEGNMFL